MNSTNEMIIFLFWLGILIVVGIGYSSDIVDVNKVCTDFGYKIYSNGYCYDDNRSIEVPTTIRNEYSKQR